MSSIMKQELGIERRVLVVCCLSGLERHVKISCRSRKFPGNDGYRPPIPVLRCLSTNDEPERRDLVLGWTAPNGIAMCQIELVEGLKRGRPSMEKITRI